MQYRYLSYKVPIGYRATEYADLVSLIDDDEFKELPSILQYTLDQHS